MAQTRLRICAVPSEPSMFKRVVNGSLWTHIRGAQTDLSVHCGHNSHELVTRISIRNIKYMQHEHAQYLCT